MRLNSALRDASLQRHLSHAALWLLCCLGGGLIAVLALYLAPASLFDPSSLPLCRPPLQQAVAPAAGPPSASR